MHDPSRAQHGTGPGCSRHSPTISSARVLRLDGRGIGLGVRLAGVGYNLEPKDLSAYWRALGDSLA